MGWKTLAKGLVSFLNKDLKGLQVIGRQMRLVSHTKSSDVH